jgi:hypothetical protein
MAIPLVSVTLYLILIMSGSELKHVDAYTDLENCQKDYLQYKEVVDAAKAARPEELKEWYLTECESLTYPVSPK